MLCTLFWWVFCSVKGPPGSSGFPGPQGIQGFQGIEGLPGNFGCIFTYEKKCNRCDEGK